MKRLARRVIIRLFAAAWVGVEAQGAALIMAGILADRLTQSEPLC